MKQSCEWVKIDRAKAKLMRINNSMNRLHCCANLFLITFDLLAEDDDTHAIARLYGCHLPPWIYEPDSLPSVYKKVFDKSLSLDGSIDTRKVTDILLSSNIPKEKLRDIWSMANKKNPGVLVEDELYLILGLVALSQVSYGRFLSVLSIVQFIHGSLYLNFLFLVILPPCFLMIR